MNSVSLHSTWESSLENTVAIVTGGGSGIGKAGASQTNMTYEQFREKALRRVPLQKIIQSREVADLVYFLFSPAGNNVTGQSINICGGQVMH